MNKYGNTKLKIKNDIFLLLCAVIIILLHLHSSNYDN
jgi:hypothetical protein